MSAELRIDKEFESLCPKLTEEEHKLLAEQIESDGCRDAIVTWANHDDTIIDGYNRYRICRKKGIGFKTKAMTFASRADAINWIVKNQIGRRNLNESQRAVLAARMVTTAGPGKPEANSLNSTNKPISTAKSAEICNVGVSAVQNAKKVLDKGSSQLVEAVTQGEVSVSAAAAIVELPKAEQTKAVKNGAVAKVAKEVKAKKKPKGPDFDPEKLDKELEAEEAGKPKTPAEIMGAVQAEYDACLNHLKQSRAVFNKLKGEERSGPWLVESQARIVQHFEGIRDILSAVRPGGLCTKCKGSGCEFCHKTGHLTGQYLRSRNK
jgi:hypothetical protein